MERVFRQVGLQGASIDMRLLRYITSAFIDVFGITHPSIDARDQAARYIGFVLFAMIMGLILVFVLAARVLGR